VIWSNRRFDHPSLYPICPVLQCAGLSDVGQHVGGRSGMSLHLVSLRDLPHTCPCTYFYLTKKTERAETKTLPV
jgi:hypothetical protein